MSVPSGLGIGSDVLVLENVDPYGGGLFCNLVKMHQTFNPY